MDEEEKLRQEYRKKYADKDMERINSMFDKVEEREQEVQELKHKENTEAMDTYKDMVDNKFFYVDYDDVRYKVKRNFSIFDLEIIKSKSGDDIEGKMKAIHKQIVEPELTFKEFIDLPAYLIKYIEQKLYEFFLLGIHKVSRIQKELNSQQDQTL